METSRRWLTTKDHCRSSLVKLSGPVWSSDQFAFSQSQMPRFVGAWGDSSPLFGVGWQARSVDMARSSPYVHDDPFGQGDPGHACKRRSERRQVRERSSVGWWRRRACGAIGTQRYVLCERMR